MIFEICFCKKPKDVKLYTIRFLKFVFSKCFVTLFYGGLTAFPRTGQSLGAAAEDTPVRILRIVVLLLKKPVINVSYRRRTVGIRVTLSSDRS